jgi:hypothetical protein
MNSLDLKSMEESIVEILKSLKDTSSIAQAEKRFYKQWRELGCHLFENQMQEEIRTYEKTLSSPQQRWSRNYQTRFGTIRLERSAYSSTEGLSCPADKFFALPENGWLASVEKLACLFGMETDFVNAAEILNETTGIEVSGHTLANHVEELGQQMYHQQKEMPLQEICPRDSALKKTVGKISPKPYVYLGQDGIMVPLNQKQGYKEALVGVVFWEKSHMAVSPKRNEVRYRHYVATLGSRESFGEQFFKSFSYLVVEQPCQVVALGDGAHWIWEQVSLYYPDAIQILDFYHLSEYVWNVAREAFPDKDRQNTWVAEQLTALKESRAQDVLTGLRFFSHRRASKVKDAVDRLKTYLENNLCRVDYARYLQLGLMIGSGVVESSNRRVVAQRLKQAGMHWSIQGANSIMTLRAAYLSSGSQWRNFWLQREVS